MFQNPTTLKAEELSAAEAHAALLVEPATPPPGIEWMAMMEQMQAKMKQLEQENDLFKLLFDSNPSEAKEGRDSEAWGPKGQPAEYFMTPQKATAAAPEAATPTPWKQDWEDPWRTRPDPWTNST